MGLPLEKARRWMYMCRHSHCRRFDCPVVLRLLARSTHAHLRARLPTCLHCPTLFFLVGSVEKRSRTPMAMAICKALEIEGVQRSEVP